MNREEAITILKNISWQMGSVKRWENIEAIDMAIEALSADTVSREQYDYVCEEYNRLVHKAVCIKLCDENCEYEKGKTCYHAREHSAIEALKQEPVVRCKDCIHAEKMNKTWTDGRQIVFCRKYRKERFTASDGYCECGERAKE